MLGHDVEGFFEMCPDGAMVLDTETGAISRTNERSARLCGRPREDLSGTHLRELTPEGWSPETSLDAVLDGDGPRTFEWRVERPDGTVATLHCAMGRIPESDGGRALLTVRDHPGQVPTSGDEDRSERELLELLDGMNDAVMVVDFDGNFVDVNQVAVDRLGYSRDELLSMGAADVSPPEHADQVGQRLRKIEQNETLVFESVQVSASGEEFPVEINASRINYRGDAAVLSVARDISSRKERRRRLRTFEQAIEQTGHAVYITDTDGTIEYVNPAFEEITGYGADEAIGRTPSILTSGTAGEEYYEALWETILDGRIWQEAIENERADGTRYHADQTIAPIVEDGEVVRFVAIQQDVTERKRREWALEDLHRATRELIVADTREEIAAIASETAENALDLPLNGVHLYDGEGRLEPVAATPTTREILGDLPTFGDGDGLAWDAFVSNEVRTSEDVRQEPGVLNEDTPVRSEIILPLGDHGVILIGSRTVDDFDESDVALAGILAGNVEVAMDLAERERELQRYQQLIENVPVGVYRNTPGLAGKFEEINPAMVEIFDADSKAELLDTHVAELYRAPGHRELFSRKLDAEGIVIDEEIRMETVTGEPFWGAVSAFRHETDGEVYYDGIVQDITERREAERELRLREQRFRRLFEDHNATMLLIDPETGAIERANRAAADFYGYDESELTSMTIQGINQIPDAEVACHRQKADQGETNRFIFPHELASGEIRQVEVDSSPIHTGGKRLLFSIIHDVTERERNRRRLERQNEQLEVLNRVVRHDIRNDMAVVLSYAELLADHVDESGEEYLQSVVEHSEHAVDLTRNVRELMETMLEGGDSESGVVTLSRVLGEEIEAAEGGYESAEFAVERPLPDVAVVANGMLSSVFRNVLTNAVKHNDKETPRVSVATEEREDTVVVRVADNGPGVSDDQKEEIFGKGEHGIESSGTGLGLYLVYTFVEQFGGDVWVTDNDPEGAVFHVELQKAE